MERQPHPEDSAYRDKSTKKKLDSKKTKSPGQRLEDSGQYLKDPETEDLSKGSLMIKGTEMSPEMKETYKNNPGYPKFNEGTKKVMQGTKRGSKERLQGLKENIGNYGRLAIRANPTGMVLPIVTGAASLMIKSLQGQILGGI